jgi:hypothetical protein
VTNPASPPDPAPQPEKVVQYKGAPLEAARGPGLGCFWFQVVVLAVVIVLTPLSAAWNWPVPISIVLLATMLVLLLFVGQTAIFLMRLVAADRRAAGRRRPRGSATSTVGELEDAEGAEDAEGLADDAELETDDPEERHVRPGETPGGGVRE